MNCPTHGDKVYKDFAELKRFRYRCFQCDWHSEIMIDENTPLSIDELHKKQKDE